MKSNKSWFYIILLIIGLANVQNAKAQKSVSCDSAKVLTYPINDAVTSYTNDYYWFKVTMDSGEYSINITNLPGVGKIIKGEVYTGTCPSLSLVSTDTLMNSIDTAFNIGIHNTINSSAFYVKLYNRGGSVSFKKIMATSIIIAGQIGFCPGQQVTLFAGPVNPNGTQSYTWQPGGAHTRSITITPTSTVSPTTFTLTYRDTDGALTTTVNIFPLGPNECKDCEQVQNGHLEWYNTFAFNSINGAQFWKNAYQGSSPYFNANMNGLNTPSHSGIAYSGVTTYNYGGVVPCYIQNSLRCSLIQGQQYEVSFFTKLWYQSATATNNIGAYLSPTAINSSTTFAMTYTPQVNRTTVLNYSTSWTQVSGIITGNNEQYITLGNFYDPANTLHVASTSTSAISGNNLSLYLIDDVSITPVTPTISVSSNTINCNSASTITLTAVGCSSVYTTWTNGITTYSGSVVTITTPTTTTTYTCSLNLPCASCTPITQTIIITVVSPPLGVTASASSSVICFGESSNLTASGASTYTWSPGAITGSTIAVTPTITTTYTVTGTNTVGCISTGTVKVIVKPSPTLTIITNTTTICLGSSLTMTAFGASTYSWSPGSLTGNTVVVTPTTTITYTVVGTSLLNCTNSKTVTINVTPNPTVTATASPTNICPGDNVVLTASGATTYSWSTGATSASLNVTPTVTSIYTVTGTSSSCSNTKTISITVKASPTVTAIANPTLICSGQNSTLTASGATTYTWNTGATSASISISPTITTIYTVTGTSVNTCINTKTVSINVGPYDPVITLNSTFVNVCGNGSATLTASGADTYTWQPMATNGSTAVVTPTAVTVYTVSGNYSVGGCGTVTAIATILVNPVISTLCCSASYTTIGTSLTSSVNMASGTHEGYSTVIDIQGTVTFTGNTSFYGYIFRMAPNAKLVVDPAKNLTLHDCKLFSCNELWDGIYIGINSTAASNIYLENTTIEDMYNGIVMDYSNRTLNNGAITSLVTSSLNKNYISLQMKNSPGMLTSTARYPFVMITSTLSSNASNTSPGNTLKPSSTYTYAYNNILGGATSSTNTPYVNFPRAFTGIVLNNLGSTSPVILGDSTTTGNTNTFDNLDFGVTGTEVILKVHNNYFKNITGSIKQGGGIELPPPASGPDEIGIAIAMTHTNTNTYALTVGTHTILPSSGNPYPKGNIFEDCNKGISALSCKNVYAKGNVFTATTTSTLVTVQLNTYCYYKAQNGIWVNALSDYETLSYNYIRNCSNSIYSSHTFASSGPSIFIRENDIQAPSTTGYCKQAIQITQVGGVNISGEKLIVYNNTIANVYNGIFAYGVLGGLTIHTNTISVESTAKFLGSTATTPRTAVALTGCQYGYVQGNTISSNASSVPSTSIAAQYLNGISITNSTLGKIECNLTDNLGRDFVFQGTCNNRWLANTMQNSYRGLELRLNGVIGQQGALTYTPGLSNLSANTWTTLTEETYVLGTTNANTASQLYLLSGGSPKTEPTLNYPTASSSRYQTGASGGIQVTSGTSYSCTNGIASRMIDGNNTNINSNSYKRTTGASSDSLAEYTSLATDDETTYEVFSDEFLYQNKQLVYKLLVQDSINAASGSTLDDFYNTTQNTAIDKLTAVQIAIANNDVNSANSANASIVSANQVEQKHQRANELILKYLNNRYYNYTSGERADLFSMANECIVKGYYVVQARNIMDIIMNQAMSYDDVCDVEHNASRKAKSLSNTTSGATSFLLFPNPNNGTMQLDYDLGNSSIATMNLFDVTGKLIYIYKLQNTKGTIQMNEQTLHNGIYFYHILVGDKIIKTDKIVIIQ